MEPTFSRDEMLKLDNQLCFPLYAASRLVQRMYHPLLEPHGLTYAQYIVLMVLWEDAPCTVSHIAERTILNTNTITPVLKRLEQQGHITRTRSQQDERVVKIELTPSGQELHSVLGDIPERLYSSLGSSDEELWALKQQLHRFIEQLQVVVEDE